MFIKRFIFLLVVLFWVYSSDAQYIDPFVVDFYEQAGIELEWSNAADDKAWYSGEIVDMDKLAEIGIPVDDFSANDVKINIMLGDRWRVDLEIDTTRYELWYYPGVWEMFYKYDRINENVSVDFDEICDLSTLKSGDDLFGLWRSITGDAFFVDTKMIMFGTSWPGIKDEFKYEYLDTIETGDDVTFMYYGDYMWKYIFPETGLEMKIIFTPGNFIKR